MMLAAVSFYSVAVAQTKIILNTDEGLRPSFTLPPSGQRGGTPDTLPISPGSPFFDDFAYPSVYPDTNRWFSAPGDLTTPLITRNKALNPPTRGAATFDGANKTGEVYNPANIASGVSDRLLSHYIDLSPWTVSSQAKLSFFLQPAGTGEKPEATDSFFVYFRTTLPPPDDFKKVLAVGGGASTPFRQYIIPLDDPGYFHTGFQLLFQTVGSQNGALDVWHLDYVLLGLNRPGNDTTYNDRSPVSLVTSILHPYAAIPIQHFQGNTQAFAALTGNLDAQSRNETITARLTSPVGGNNINFTQAQTTALPPYAVAQQNFPAFGAAPLNGISGLELTLTTPDAGDLRPENNTLIETFRIDSIFAYDDGEADASFGLNQALGFGVKFTLPQPDSLSAVWIHFEPTVNYNAVTGKATYMKDKSFRLAVWKDAHPDSLILQQIGGMKVAYGNTPNHFQRYALSSPLQVPQTFWVGVQQIDTEPLGVGFDYSYDNDAFVYWDSLGHWINTRLGGSLMIRAEMYNTAQVLPTPVEKVIPSRAVRLYPNPFYGGIAGVKTAGFPEGTAYSAEIWNLRGQKLQTINYGKMTSPDMEIALEAALPEGLLVWKHIFILPGGETRYFTEKLLILP
ncbi:MAG: hypothetical protein R3C61_09950 [Bacteroidia bacterium]